MDKRVWWAIAVVVLIAILYFVFRPTGNVILEEGVLNEMNESADLIPGEISVCGNIASEGTYVLAGDLSADDLNESSCFTINADNVVLNCAGKSISGSNGVGVNVAGINAVLQDCTINIENGEAISVGEGATLNVKKSMNIGVKDQNGANVNGASVSVSAGEGNDTISVEGATSNGTVTLVVVSSAYTGANAISYVNYTISVSKSGFNGTSVVSEGIADAEVAIIDITAPVVAISGTPTTTSSSATINYNVNENGILASCTGKVGDKGVLDNDAVIGSNSVQVTGLDDDTDYSSFVICTDSAGLTTQSSSVSIKTPNYVPPATSNTTTTTTKTTTPAPTSTAGQFNMTYSATVTQLANGYTKAMKLDERMRIIVAGKVYFMQVSKLAENSASLTPLLGTGVVAGSAVSLNAGGAEKIDLDGDKNYDIAVILKSATASSAELTFIKASGPVIETPAVTEEETAPETELESVPITGAAVEGEEGGSNIFLAIIVILIIAVIVVAVIVIQRWIQVKAFLKSHFGKDAVAKKK
jgi:hypothetical protein